jgi:Asp-tRNA(Asn)/Glu-tRNA(Gln) amidotransferase B subunit
MEKVKVNPNNVTRPEKEVSSPDLYGIIRKLNSDEISQKQGKELVKLCHKHLKKIDRAINKFEKEIMNLSKAKKKKSIAEELPKKPGK